MKHFGVPRMFLWKLIASALLVAVAMLAPQNLPVLAWKLLVLVVAGVIGYWFDRALYPYARPHRFISPLSKVHEDNFDPVDAVLVSDATWELVFAAAMIRRALVILGFVIAAAVAL